MRRSLHRGQPESGLSMTLSEPTQVTSQKIKFCIQSHPSSFMYKVSRRFKISWYVE